jgi:hypothetical protein
VVIPGPEETASRAPPPAIGRAPYFEVRAPRPERPERAPFEDLLGSLALNEPLGAPPPVELHALAGVSYFASGGLPVTGAGGPFVWPSSTRGPWFPAAGPSGPARFASGGLPGWSRPSAPSLPAPPAGPPPPNSPFPGPPDDPPPEPPRVLIPEPSAAALVLSGLVLAAGWAACRGLRTLPRSDFAPAPPRHDFAESPADNAGPPMPKPCDAQALARHGVGVAAVGVLVELRRHFPRSTPMAAERSSGRRR